MLLDDFIKYLKGLKDISIKLELKGIIETNIEIQQAIIEEIDRYLIIKNKQDNKQKIKINLHQLMKISKLDKNSFFLEFDQLQTIKMLLLS